MNHLVSYSQIISNLRRTADNGLISLLNQKQLEEKLKNIKVILKHMLMLKVIINHL